MKRKNRKRLAKEAEIAKKEARGDFSHLKDKKGKFIGAPLPQPSLPKVGLSDDDLYASTYPESDGGSMRGDMKKSASGDNYSSYPPSTSAGNLASLNYTNGFTRPPYVGQYTTTSSYYQNNDSNHLYAESTHSHDDFAHRGADLGYDNGYGESSLALTENVGRPGFSSAPSYQSQAGEYVPYSHRSNNGEESNDVAHGDRYCGEKQQPYHNIHGGGEKYDHEEDYEYVDEQPYQLQQPHPNTNHYPYQEDDHSNDSRHQHYPSQQSQPYRSSPDSPQQQSQLQSTLQPESRRDRRQSNYYPSQPTRPQQERVRGPSNSSQPYASGGSGTEEWEESRGRTEDNVSQYRSHY
jgi:hypothetical protein